MSDSIHRKGESKCIAQITLEHIGNVMTAAGLAGAETLAASVAELAEFTACADTIISLPRVFQVGGVGNA